MRGSDSHAFGDTLGRHHRTPEGTGPERNLLRRACDKPSEIATRFHADGGQRQLVAESRIIRLDARTLRMAHEEHHAVAALQLMAHVRQRPIKAYTQFLQRHEHKVALFRPRMGQDQFGRRAYQPAKIDKIQIDSPRTIAHRTHTAERGFNFVHPPREFVRTECGLENRGLIEKLAIGEFVGHIHWLGFDRRTLADQPRARKQRKLLYRRGEIAFARGDVRTKCDNRARQASITTEIIDIVSGASAQS